jgi:hypothetical protein
MTENQTADWLHHKIVALELELELLERAGAIIIAEPIRQLVAALKAELARLK